MADSILAAGATLHHGSPIMADYTATAAVVAGAVVVQNDATGILTQVAHNAIASGKLGALACGGGVYKMPIAAGTYFAGVPVWWSTAATALVATASTFCHFGFLLEGVAGAAAGTAVALHNPCQTTSGTE